MLNFSLPILIHTMKHYYSVILDIQTIIYHVYYIRRQKIFVTMYTVKNR